MLFNLMLNSQNIIAPSTIKSNTIWDYDTVFLIQDILIFDGNALSISPGTVIVSEGYQTIDVRGSIHAIGNINNRIIFTVNDTLGFSNFANNQGGWGGIHFFNTSETNDSSIFDYCILEYGKAVGNFTADFGGGALYINSYDKIRISNSIIRYNKAAFQGGGLCLKFSSAKIIGNEFYYNEVDKCKRGGAIYIEKKSKAIVQNNIFKYNKASMGAAVYIGSLGFNHDAPLIINNKCFNNIGCSGIIYESSINSFIINNLVCNNKGIPIMGGHTIGIGRYINNTIANNDTYSNEGIISHNDQTIAINNIVWNNVDGEYIGEDTLSINAFNQKIDIIEYNLLFDDHIIGEGNLGSKDPLFKNPSPGIGLEYDGELYDWSLKDESPCINAGKPITSGDYKILDKDIYGFQRIYGGRIDMGAIENQSIILNDIDLDLKNDIIIYPNPSNSIITIKGISYFYENIKIFDVIGSQIMAIPLNEKRESFTMDISELNEGIYFIKIGNKLKKFIKK